MPKLLPVKPSRVAKVMAGVAPLATTGGSQGSIIITVLTGPNVVRYVASVATPAFFHVNGACSR